MGFLSAGNPSKNIIRVREEEGLSIALPRSLPHCLMIIDLVKAFSVQSLCPHSACVCISMCICLNSSVHVSVCSQGALCDPFPNSKPFIPLPELCSWRFLGFWLHPDIWPDPWDLVFQMFHHGDPIRDVLKVDEDNYTKVAQRHSEEGILLTFRMQVGGHGGVSLSPSPAMFNPTCFCTKSQWDWFNCIAGYLRS